MRNAPPGDEACSPSVVQMCEWLEISKSGYYDWRSRPQSAAAKRHELLKIKVKELFDANNGEYGYRRVHAALVRGGEQVDDETVRGVMRVHRWICGNPDSGSLIQRHCALSESVNGTLKVELVHRTVYPTRQKARDDIAR
jgi:hypothetical protein